MEKSEDLVIALASQHPYVFKAIARNFQCWK